MKAYMITYIFTKMNSNGHGCIVVTLDSGLPTFDYILNILDEVKERNHLSEITSTGIFEIGNP